MITKCLNIIKFCNTEVSPKYAFVDFNEREKTGLELVFPVIHIFLCDFHIEQTWNKSVSKIENNETLKLSKQ